MTLGAEEEGKARGNKMRGETTTKKLLTKYGSFQGVKEALEKDEKEFELDMGKKVTGILVKYFYDGF